MKPDIKILLSIRATKFIVELNSKHQTIIFNLNLKSIQFVCFARYIENKQFPKQGASEKILFFSFLSMKIFQ